MAEVLDLLVNEQYPRLTSCPKTQAHFSQMLGSESGATRTYAREMLPQARNWKESTRCTS